MGCGRRVSLTSLAHIYQNSLLCVLWLGWTARGILPEGSENRNEAAAILQLADTVTYLLVHLLIEGGS